MTTYEGFGTPDVQRALLVMFDTPAYFDFYPTIARKYKDFEFRDELTDAQRLDEFASIYQQLRKFVGSKQSMVLSFQEDLHALRAWIDQQVEKSDTYPRTRIDMVYNSLKVDWLRQARNQVDSLIEQREER